MSLAVFSADAAMEMSTAVEFQASVAVQKQATGSRRDALQPGPRSGVWLQGGASKGGQGCVISPVSGAAAVAWFCSALAAARRRPADCLSR